MKTTLSLLLLSVSATAGVYSIETRPYVRSAARDLAAETPTGEELNANLREAATIFVSGPSNLHQCLNHCDRHTSKSEQWIESCEEDCYDQYQPACYNQGDECKKDEDCHTGGTNYCTRCGQTEGAEYFHECYSPAPAPTPSPIEPVACYNLGDSCVQNSDCHTGGTNFCQKCGQDHGTEYFHRCYSPNGGEEDEGRVLELIEEDGPTWDDIKNGTKRAAEKTADGTKEAGKKTAEWGKDTFDPSSGYRAWSGTLLVASGTLLVAVLA